MEPHRVRRAETVHDLHLVHNSVHQCLAQGSQAASMSAHDTEFAGGDTWKPEPAPRMSLCTDLVYAFDGHILHGLFLPPFVDLW